MTKQEKERSKKVKEAIRRIFALPFFVVYLPFFWLFSNSSFKELWEEFIEFTKVKGVMY